MAMFECPGCKRIVDEETKVCFNCGYNIKKYVKELKKGKKNIGKETMSLSSVYSNDKVAAINLPKLDFLSGKKAEDKPAEKAAPVEQPIFDSPLLNAQAKKIEEAQAPVPTAETVAAPVAEPTPAPAPSVGLNPTAPLPSAGLNPEAPLPTAGLNPAAPIPAAGLNPEAPLPVAPAPAAPVASAPMQAPNPFRDTVATSAPIPAPVAPVAPLPPSPAPAPAAPVEQPIFDSPALNARANEIASGVAPSSATQAAAQVAPAPVPAAGLNPAAPLPAAGLNPAAPVPAAPIPNGNPFASANQSYGATPVGAPNPLTSNVAAPKPAQNTFNPNLFNANVSSAGNNNPGVAGNPLLSAAPAPSAAPKKEPKRIIKPEAPKEELLFESPLLNMEAKKIASGEILPANQRPKEEKTTQEFGSMFGEHSNSVANATINKNPAGVFTTYGQQRAPGHIPPYAAQPVQQQQHSANPLLQSQSPAAAPVNPFMAANSSLGGGNPLLAGNPLLGGGAAPAGQAPGGTFGQ